MKLTKKRGYEGSVRMVWNDDKTKRVGIIGQVGDLLDEGLFDKCDACRTDWAFITPEGKAIFNISKPNVMIAARRYADS